jgi:hypothetical protein
MDVFRTSAASADAHVRYDHIVCQAFKSVLLSSTTRKKIHAHDPYKLYVVARKRTDFFSTAVHLDQCRVFRRRRR